MTTFNILIGNTISEDLSGVLSLGASNSGYADRPELPPSEVPVPAALPLMASALGVFGLGAKRRKALKALSNLLFKTAKENNNRGQTTINLHFHALILKQS